MVLCTGSAVWIRVERYRASARILPIAVLCLHQHEARPWRERRISNIQTTVPKDHATESYLSFSLLWRLVRDVDSPAPGCGHQCFKELSAFVRLCISPKLVKFVVYFNFRTSFLFLTLHIQILSLGTVLSALLGQVGSTDCLFLSRLAPTEFALCCMFGKKKKEERNPQQKQYRKEPKRGLVSHSVIC